MCIYFYSVKGLIKDFNLGVYGAQTWLWMDPANEAGPIDFFMPVDVIQLDIIIMILLY